MNQAVRKYWDAKIRAWAKSCYGKKGADETAAKGFEKQGGLFGPVMDYLRRSVEARLETATELLVPVVRGMRVLELGCGTGELARRLGDAGAASVEGWDIAPEAVRLSRLRIEQAGLADRVTFREADLNDTEPPAVDLVCGLGLLDWITLPDVEALAQRIRCKHFLFSFSEKDGSLAERIHRAYLVNPLKRKNMGFGADHFPRQAVIDIFARAGWPDAKLLKTRAMRFGVILYDLPPSKGRQQRSA